MKENHLRLLMNEPEGDRVLREARAYREGITEWARAYARRPRHAEDSQEICAAAVLDLRRWSSAYVQQRIASPIASIGEPRNDTSPASSRDARTVSVA